MSAFDLSRLVPNGERPCSEAADGFTLSPRSEALVASRLKWRLRSNRSLKRLHRSVKRHKHWKTRASPLPGCGQTFQPRAEAIFHPQKYNLIPFYTHHLPPAIVPSSYAFQAKIHQFSPEPRLRASLRCCLTALLSCRHVWAEIRSTPHKGADSVY